MFVLILKMTFCCLLYFHRELIPGNYPSGDYKLKVQEIVADRLIDAIGFMCYKKTLLAY